MNITDLKWDSTVDATTIAALQQAFDGRVYVIAVEPLKQLRHRGRLVVIGNEQRHADCHLQDEEFDLVKQDLLAFRKRIALPILESLK